MFDSKSDYALNKLDREAIVCKTACGAYVRLTEADFSSREEFLRWKEISDQDYHDTETRQREDDHCLSLNDRISVPSAEERLLSACGLSGRASADGETLREIRRILGTVPASDDAPCREKDDAGNCGAGGRGAAGRVKIHYCRPQKNISEIFPFDKKIGCQNSPFHHAIWRA